MVKLPSKFEQHTLRDMHEGEEVWTVPWAMYAEEDGELYLNGHYSADKRSGGTVSMKVRRARKGYEVDITRCGWFEWSKRGASYVGGSDAIPVAKLTH